MRRPFSRGQQDDYEQRRHDPISGGHLRGAHGYGGARSNDSDMEPPGGSWGLRETREIGPRDHERHGFRPQRDAQSDARFDDWDEDRYGYPEATSYGREMQRARAGYRPDGRFAEHDESLRGGVEWPRDVERRGPGRGQASAPDAGSGYGYGRQQGDERSRMTSRDSGQDYGRYAGSFGAREPRREAWQAERGPKGYTRADERIRDDVCERLYHEPGIDVREVSVQVQNGKVILDGTVSDRAMKHRIEDLCETCIGVREIDDRIRIERVADALRRAESIADDVEGERSGDGRRDDSAEAGSRH